MPILAVISEQGMEGTVADGIFGLCPLEEETNHPPFILDLLKSNNLIQSRILSFALHQPNQQSMLIFGTPDYSLAYTSPTYNFSVPLVDRGNYYKIEMSQANYGSVILTSST